MRQIGTIGGLDTAESRQLKVNYENVHNTIKLRGSKFHNVNINKYLLKIECPVKM